MTTQQLNVRIPEITQQQLKAIQEATGLTQTQIIIMAIDRLAAQTTQTEAPQK